MTFSIAFKRPANTVGELGNAAAEGEIVLGDYSESFLSLIGFWSPSDYQSHWHASVERLVHDGRDSCLITSLQDPAESEYLMWWLLYPAGHTVFVQNALLLYKNLTKSFVPSDPYRAVPARRTLTGDGDPISEWELSLADFAAFASGPPAP